MDFLKELLLSMMTIPDQYQIELTIIWYGILFFSITYVVCIVKSKIDKKFAKIFRAIENKWKDYHLILASFFLPIVGCLFSLRKLHCKHSLWLWFSIVLVILFFIAVFLSVKIKIDIKKIIILINLTLTELFLIMQAAIHENNFALALLAKNIATMLIAIMQYYAIGPYFTITEKIEEHLRKNSSPFSGSSYDTTDPAP